MEDEKSKLLLLTSSSTLVVTRNYQYYVFFLCEKTGTCFRVGAVGAMVAGAPQGVGVARLDT